MSNYGGYLSIQRNFTEHSGLRLTGNYNSVSGTWGTDNSETTTTTAIWGGLDYVYYFVPCESLSPFLTFGVGATNYSHDNPQDLDPDGDDATIEMVIGFSLGAEASISEDWKFKSELGFYSVGTSYYDGTWGTDGGGLIGSSTDAFMKFDLGLQWYFSKGEPSKICQLYDGIEQIDMTYYNRIEEIVKKHIPREVVREVVVEKEVPSQNDRMILMGVNFDFNSSKLKPESYPILYHAAQMMHQNPNTSVEVQGYCDNIGSDKINLKISKMRADAVKNYLVARGISENRISTEGYGSANPIADNKVAAGRTMNRRIEFKVLK
jgi:OOP family OmpA-OmpF porin